MQLENLQGQRVPCCEPSLNMCFGSESLLPVMCWQVQWQRTTVQVVVDNNIVVIVVCHS